jgi:hypothetical protein
MSVVDICQLRSQAELFEAFEQDPAPSKHLLILYSLVIGLRAKIIADLGIGRTTSAIRTAAQATGGVVYSCDADSRLFEPLLAHQDDRWRVFLEFSDKFIPRVPVPIDFAMHDAAHDYQTVRRDLALLIPRMRTFGIICVHDTQQPDLAQDMLGAIRDATSPFQVSVTNLPFSAGLAIIRVEKSEHPPISPSGHTLPDGRPDTMLMPFPCTVGTNGTPALSTNSAATHLTRLRARVSLALRQAGLRR